MKNLTLLMVLVSGLLAGYFVGDYRGRAAREALQEAMATGEALNSELESSRKTLKAELEAIRRQDAQELQASRQKYQNRAAEWQRTKASLDETIKRQREAVARADAKRSAMTADFRAATGTKAVLIGQEIDRLKQESDAMRREMEGNVCLKARVPQSVIDTLNVSDSENDGHER